MNEYEDKIQLCCSCARACGDCPWSARQKPIKGWVAEPAQIKTYKVVEGEQERYSNGAHKATQKTLDTWFIKECPMFLADAEDNGRKRIENETIRRIRKVVRNRTASSGISALQQGIIDQAVADWKHAVTAIMGRRFRGETQAIAILREFYDAERFFNSRWFRAMLEVEDVSFDTLSVLYRAYGLKRELVQRVVEGIENSIERRRNAKNGK